MTLSSAWPQMKNKIVEETLMSRKSLLMFPKMFSVQAPTEDWLGKQNLLSSYLKAKKSLYIFRKHFVFPGNVA